MALSIQGVPGDGSIRESFTISGSAGTYRVGRHRDCDFLIDHRSVSGVHARIEASGVNGVELVDCDSSNGTFVNGVRIERHELSPGDRIRFATMEFEVVEGEVVSPREAKTTRVSVLPGASDPAGDADDSKERELKRELEEEAQRSERLSGELRDSRSAILEREQKIAELEFELNRREGALAQNEKRIAELLEETQRWKKAEESSREGLAARDEELEATQRELDQVAAEREKLVGRIESLGEELAEDWREWISFSDLEAAEREEGEAALGRIESMREQIRAELNKIEPIWMAFGEGVQDELRARCDALREEGQDLEEKRKDAEVELEARKQDLAELRSDIDRELRRAQGLSRGSTEIELPKRFESMMIARDSEQGIFLQLIERVEFLERLLEGYRRSRRLKEVVRELNEFRTRLVTILEDHGVEEFRWGKGTILTLKHRKEVQILERKGWGTREFIEKPFQPGEVTQVVRNGYRVGEGDQAAILRKVEVLIREDAG